MADGDVAFHREGGYGQRGNIDAQVLAEDHDPAADVPDDALVYDDEVLPDRGERSRDQEQYISYCQRQQVTVGRAAHRASPRHDYHHHDVPYQTDQEHARHQQAADYLVREGKVLRHA